MLLKAVKTEGFRSIRDQELKVEKNVTVIIGANDHGKTNVLDAIRLLNRDKLLEKASDLSWDISASTEDYPRLTFTFNLSSQERALIAEAENEHRAILLKSQLLDDEGLARLREQITAKNDALVPSRERIGAQQGIVAAAQAVYNSDPNNPQYKQELENRRKKLDRFLTADEKILTELISLEAQLESVMEYRAKGDQPIDITATDVPAELILVRSGEDPSFKIDTSFEHISEGVMTKFLDRLPRVELISTFDKVPDSITIAELQNDSNEFMKGILFHAGLGEDEWPGIFEQNERTMKRLDDASSVLNRTLSQAWTQGSGLEFRLQHNSQRQTIELSIKDPAVKAQYVKVSRRSSGFTHFFALKTILNARREQHPANSYIWLFDEPGIHLHPSGQQDLLRELESLGQQQQVLYSTHSLFMMNKIYPTRHRLITKSENGTKISGKPFSGRWKSVLTSLGISQTGTILFANHVLITEGDSDPILISAVLQKLVEIGKLDLDLNSLSVMAASNSTDADVLIRTLSDSTPTPNLAILLDGDKGGTNRRKKLKRTAHELGIPIIQLDPLDSVIEDFLPMASELYVQAAANYIYKVLEDRDDSPVSLASIQEKLSESFQAKFDGSRHLTKVCDWAADSAKETFNLADPSKCGIAREYVNLLTEVRSESMDDRAIDRFLTLASEIKAQLHIPGLMDASGAILE